MHTTLRDLEDDNTLDSMTITLPCRHVFTVETLDGITHLGDFYEKDSDANGRWVKAKTPEASGETRTRPTCPTCRGSIDSLRYGRVCKNSNLAILQHNIASSLSRQLSRAEVKLKVVREGLAEAIINSVKACVGTPTESNAVTDLTTDARQEMTNDLDIVLVREIDRPTPAEAIENIDRLHAFPKSYAKNWRKAVAKVLEPYRVARQVTCERDPAVQAYEASLTRLYHEELEQYGVNMSLGAPQDLEQHCLRLARIRIGQVPPRASLRFVIEAFWITVDILMQLGMAVGKAGEEVRSRDASPGNSGNWDTLAGFFLRQAVKDAETACTLATQSESWNKLIKCQIFALQARYELATHQCRTAINQGALSNNEAREELVEMCERGIKHIEDLRISVPRFYLAKWSAEEVAAKREWLRTNFMQPLAVILKSWESLKQSSSSGQWYQEVTNEERAAILRAMMEGAGHDRLWHTGHFYQCPNGHPYVIGECGGAMQESRCPECGARIGGSHHRSLEGNTHATDFVNLARAGGVAESHWRWGPGQGR
ncbi:NFX1-type zinc finger protein [Ceratobasidium theobromae]|uniref:NFX1-type zinc finger protein n=1 Tax=Ceratobasidium theobromae TaxID=1582974 RepID=A0A5N5QK27_9AGAM|nr:NFX1-type zinc finger protein [Ceratobasidium theobromae]